MPEGPTIVILKEAVQAFKKKKIIAVNGNTKIGKERLLNEIIIDFKSWGKHFLICFKTFSLRVHFMLFGSYLINERKAAPERLQLQFNNGEINLYACSLLFIEGDIDIVYDWTGDVMNDNWNAKKARKKLKDKADTLVCDALLDQHIFAGVGNIIKNEVLFRIKVHPESKVGNLPAKQLSALIKEARVYSFQFFEWKKEFVLRQHWLAHNKKTCPRDNVNFTRKHLGKTHRLSFYCEWCQVKY